MHFSTTLTAAIALASTTFAAPAIIERQESLKPFSLSRFSVFSPSGRPGEYPWSTITANISDPNALNVGTSASTGDAVIVSPSSAVNCIAKYLGNEGPENRSWPCDSEGKGEGYWTMKIVRSDGWKATFLHVAEKISQGSAYKKMYEATVNLQVGDNLSGTCGGSGVCSWSLKTSPITVVQKEVV